MNCDVPLFIYCKHDRLTFDKSIIYLPIRRCPIKAAHFVLKVILIVKSKKGNLTYTWLNNTNYKPQYSCSVKRLQ
jgi:hypothetical protein